ncbi:bifunctional DNA primase/polymerase [Mycolicibacterium houstonense]|uniref:bifunctional DNA primase/polymerase n=1 Tax=Mycolicibacterium houstonense TaxID=146021 RepID=UPI000B20DED3|nr:bifunctional DNA primase/polymerase [Mycolicibacterium houstonense]
MTDIIPATGAVVGPANGVAPQSLTQDEWLQQADNNGLNGWLGAIPIGKEHKGRYKLPWVSAHHGFSASDADPDTWEQLAAQAAQRNNGTAGILALGERLPAGVLGIDVDAYDGKNGKTTLEDWERQWGPLPPTYIITARRDGVSGIRLYRVPEDYYPKEIPNSGVEFLDRHHRYIVAPPSWHHTGKRYALYLPGGKRSRSGVLPPVERIPLLPDSYVSGLPALATGAAGEHATPTEVAEFAAKYSHGPQPDAVQWVIDFTINAADADGTRNPMRDALCKAAREAKGRRYGWDNAVEQIRLAAMQAYESRSGRLDADEFDRLVAYAVGEVRDSDERQLYDAWQDPDFTAVDDLFASDVDPERRIEQLVAKELEKQEVQRRVAARTAQALLDSCSDQAFDGVAFLESGIDAEPLWGVGQQALMAPGQGSMVFGTDGAGKSTIMQQFMLARTGLGDDDVLGFPVDQSDQPILYLALDRPEQIRRSIARMVDLTDPAVRDRLKRKVIVWRGALPFHCDLDPKAFADWVMQIGGDDLGLVVADSVKDMVSSCTEDSAGMGFNDTVQHITTRGVEFACCHHNRKPNAANMRPRQLADVYGSRWLTAGLGSVLNIWKLDDQRRELTQLKTPYGSPVDPVEYTDDYTRGVSSTTTNWTDALVSALVTAGSSGLTDAEAVAEAFNVAPKDDAFHACRKRITRLLRHWTEEPGTAYERTETLRNGKEYKVWRIKNS